MFLYLASQSPRRRELLRQIGVVFKPLAVEIDESPLAGENAAAMVSRLAALKASTGRQELGRRDYDHHPEPVLGADTAVSIDDKILGKPRDAEHAKAMLKLLSGRTHQVFSAVSLCGSEKVGDKRPGAPIQQTVVSKTDVSFRCIGNDELERYWRTGEAKGKAGAYAIQGLAAVFVTGIEGSYSGVVGLPLEKLFPLLQAFGVPYWQSLATKTDNAFKHE